LVNWNWRGTDDGAPRMSQIITDACNSPTHQFTNSPLDLIDV